MHINQIWTYAVKSMVGETLEHARLGPIGLEDDRQWAVWDIERDGINGAKRIGSLMQFSARYVDGGPNAVITLPDGSTTATDDPGVHAALSAALGRDVRLEHLRPASDLAFYRRGERELDDPLADVRAVMDRQGDEPLPDFSVFPPVIMEYESPPGTFYDAYPLMILTTSSLRSLAEALPDSKIDVRRFRPNFVVDTGDAPGHPEFEWTVGSKWRVGDAVIEVRGPCPRCRMPTLPIDDTLPQDPAIMRYIVRELGQNIGTYGAVLEPGPFSVGDEFTPL